MTGRRVFKAAIVSVVGALPLLGLHAGASARTDTSSPTAERASETTRRLVNQGTIKLCDSGDLPSGCVDFPPPNQPPLTCSLSIEFRGYDEGDLDAWVVLRAWPPTGDRRTLAPQTDDDLSSISIGEDGPGGEGDEDAEVKFDLDEPLEDLRDAGFTPHPTQG